MPDFLPVDHDPFAVGTEPVDHDPFGPVPKAGKTIQPVDILGEQRGIQQGVTSGLSRALGITDAARALRGEMTPDEAETFAMTAGLGAIMPEAKAIKPLAEAAEGIPADIAHVLVRDDGERVHVLGVHRTEGGAKQAQDFLHQRLWDRQQKDDFDPEDREPYPGAAGYLDSQRNASGEVVPGNVVEIQKVPATLSGNEAYVVSANSDNGPVVHAVASSMADAKKTEDIVLRNLWQQYGEEDMDWVDENLPEGKLTPEQSASIPMVPYPGAKKATAYFRDLDIPETPKITKLVIPEDSQ